MISETCAVSDMLGRYETSAKDSPGLRLREMKNGHTGTARTARQVPLCTHRSLGLPSNRDARDSRENASIAPLVSLIVPRSRKWKTREEHSQSLESRVVIVPSLHARYRPCQRNQELLDPSRGLGFQHLGA